MRDEQVRYPVRTQAGWYPPRRLESMAALAFPGDVCGYSCNSRTMLSGVGVVAVLVAGETLLSRPAQAASASLLNIVAHPDDDLFFMNPDVLAVAAAGGSITTAYTTAGDAGQGASYWKSRELGVQAAYAQMAGVANSGMASLQVGGRTVVQRTLTGEAADPAAVPSAAGRQSGCQGLLEHPGTPVFRNSSKARSARSPRSTARRHIRWRRCRRRSSP